MTDRDPEIAALLEKLMPPTREVRDWSALLADAEGERFETTSAPGQRQKRRLLVVAVGLAVAVVIPLTALAVGLATGRGWWFLSAYTPKPAGAVVVVKSGTWDNTPWTLTAFRASTGAICYAVTANPAGPHTNPAAASFPGSTEACGPVSATSPITFLRYTGLPPQPKLRRPLPANAQQIPAQRPFPEYIVGTVTESATEIDIAGPDKTLQRIPTIAPPPGLHAEVRFFIAERPKEEDVTRLIARDANGAIVATTPVESPYELRRYRLINPGKKLPLTRAAIHELRLHHRSPDIYLISSHDGQNLYRLGKDFLAPTKIHFPAGDCFGSGRASNMRWVPPDRILRIIGIITCGGTFPSPTSPIRDTSIYGQNAGQNLMTVYQFSGIASNEVAAIDLINANGTIVQQVPIINGIYSIKPVPPGIVDLVAVNAGGVWVSHCGFGKGAYPTTRGC